MNWSNWSGLCLNSAETPLFYENHLFQIKTGKKANRCYTSCKPTTELHKDKETHNGF
jgi:hypothetical protein